jgi:glycosyltransferase involved in cell wall biosynthesis
MRVLHLDEQTGWRGGELQASWLMQGLAKRGHQVWLAGRPGSRFLTDPHGDAAITRVPMPLRSELDLGSVLRIAALVRREKIQILHAHTSHTHSLACLARLLCPGVKVVVHRRVSFPPKTDPINRWKYRAPDRIVCVSGKVLEVLAESGLPREKLALVHSAVELGRLDVEPADRAALGVADDAPLLFSAGALVGHKDHGTLLDAFVIVLEEFPDARLLIAGEGELHRALEAKAAQLGIADAVVFLGQRDDVPAITQAADLYVSSSWSEGLGTSVLEALGCGTPVVATDAGGVGEMVRHGETGLLVPARDPKALAAAMLDALLQPERSTELARKGRRLVQKQFCVDRMVEGNIAVYEGLQ